MFNRILNHLEEWLIAFLIGGATVVIFAAVVHRYVSGIPYIQDYTVQINMSWAQELCIFMFVWMAKFGAAYGVRTGIHVGVDVFINRLGNSARGKFIIIGMAAGALFTGIVAVMGTTFVWDNGAHYAIFKVIGMNVEQLIEGPTTPDLEWPTWVVYSAIPLGTGLMCFRFLQVLVGFIRTGELPHHDHGHVDGLEETLEEEVAQNTEVYNLKDNLHPDEDRTGNADRKNDAGKRP